LVKKPKNKKTKPKKNTDSEYFEKSPTIRKKLLLIISIIVVICIIVFVWFTLYSNLAKAEATAQLIVESGSVQVKQSGGTWTIAENGTILHQSDSVKTGDKSYASIIFFGSSIVRLDGNTEVTLQELLKDIDETSVKINQDAGRTWNTVSKISGIDNYEVHTPTTVASVRGTSFDFYILANGNITISVFNGTVNITTYKDGKIVNSLEVPEYLSTSIDPNNLDETPETKPVEEDDWINENLQEDEELREDLKAELYKRIDPFKPELKNLYNVTDQELEILVDAYLNGDFELPPNTPEWARKLFEFS